MKIDSIRIIELHTREVEVMVDRELNWESKHRLTFHLWETVPGEPYLEHRLTFEWSRDAKRRTHRKIFYSNKGPYIILRGSGRLYLPTAEQLVDGIADGSVPVINYFDYITECVERKMAKEKAQRDRVLGR